MRHRPKNVRTSTRPAEGRPAPDNRPATPPSSGRRLRPPPLAPQGSCWLYGRHAVLAALANNERKIHRLLATPETAARLKAELPPTADANRIETVRREDIARLLPGDAVHQGIAALTSPLPESFLGDLVTASGDHAVVVVLDQVTDPHNTGAILRSAEAFGAVGIVTTDRHAADESGTLAKAASGALERVPMAKVTNLARALRDLKESGFWIVGLSERGGTYLADAKLSGRIALVLGAEGDGLRRLTEEHCDLLVRLPMSGAMPSLNVSNAAAVALYELARTRK